MDARGSSDSRRVARRSLAEVLAKGLGVAYTVECIQSTDKGNRKESTRTLTLRRSATEKGEGNPSNGGPIGKVSIWDFQHQKVENATPLSPLYQILRGRYEKTKGAPFHHPASNQSEFSDCGVSGRTTKLIQPSFHHHLGIQTPRATPPATFPHTPPSAETKSLLYLILYFKIPKPLGRS